MCIYFSICFKIDSVARIIQYTYNNKIYLFLPQKGKVYFSHKDKYHISRAKYVILIKRWIPTYFYSINYIEHVLVRTLYNY